MRWFLDMSIIIFYSGVSDVADLIDKTKKFVDSKKGDKYLVCFYILNIDLPKWIERQDIVISELRLKLKDPSYEIGSTGNGRKLWPRDINKAKKLFYRSKEYDDNERFIENLKKINLVIKRKIDHFLNNLIDQKVIPIVDIDFDLQTNLNSVLNNGSDSKILASGIQMHNKEELVMLTGDKHDWTKDNIKLAFDSRLDEKYPKIPEIKYIQDF